MGKPKQERTEQIKRVGKNIIIREQVQNSIEQHNFDRLVENGVIVEERDSFLGQGMGSGRGGLGRLLILPYP